METKINIRTHAKQLNHLAWGAKKRHGLTWKEAMKFAFDSLRIKERMAKEVVSFAFIKLSTGEVRKANGTRNFDLIPADKHPKESKPSKDTTNTVKFFCVDKGEWRSFDISQLTPAL